MIETAIPLTGNTREVSLPKILAYLNKHDDITILNVSANRLTSSGAEALAKNEILVSLDVSFNKITEAGGVALEIARADADTAELRGAGHGNLQAMPLRELRHFEVVAHGIE